MKLCWFEINHFSSIIITKNKNKVLQEEKGNLKNKNFQLSKRIKKFPNNRE